MFKNFKLSRNHIIAGIFLLIFIVTGASMIRITYNERIIDTYNALSKPLYERSRVAMFEAVWQKYTGATRDKNITQADAQLAQQTINSAYSFMIGADVILAIAAGVLIIKPMIDERKNKTPKEGEEVEERPRRRRF